MHSPWSPDVFIDAYRFAAEAHWSPARRQVVPGTEVPYLMHFSQVAMEVAWALALEPGLDGDLALPCALLHDTLEDTDTTYGLLAEKFGHAVADGVLALTKDESVGAGLPQPRAERLRTTDCLERIARQPREIWIVKLADRITNLQPPPASWTQERKTSYREEAAEILGALGAASPCLAARLGDKIERYPL